MRSIWTRRCWGLILSRSYHTAGCSAIWPGPPSSGSWTCRRRHGQKPAPAREPGDDDDEPPDDLRPGDPAYDRAHGPDKKEYREALRRADDEAQDAEQRGNRPYSQRDWERDEPEQRRGRGRPDNSRRSDDRGDNRGRGSDGPPRNGRQFLGWLGKQDRDVKDRAGRMAKNWNLPSLMKEWTDEEAMDMYHELTAKQESASHRNGSGSGARESDRNGGY